jgi:MFS transporter, PPP family, 3-phenylpropionic acid transporter
MSGGAFHAYAGIWFASLGFSSDQIAATTSVPIFILLVLNAVSGRIADRAKDWRQALVIGALVAAVAASGLIVSTSFWSVLIFWSAVLIAQSLTVPIGDAAALYLTRQGRGDIGTYRSLSTVGYIVALFITGYAVQHFGGTIYAALFAFFNVVRLAAAVFMPEFKSSQDQSRLTTGLHLKTWLRETWLIAPLLGWAVVYSTIQVLNNFLALALKQQGYGETDITLLIAAGALAEALVFFLFRHFSSRFRLRNLIVLSGIVTILRWICMTYEPSFPILFVLQLSHGICFALGFIACISYISRYTPSENAAEAQSLFSVLQMGAAIVSVTIFGRLFGNYGVEAFWGLAVIAVIGTAISLWSLWLKTPAPIAPDRSA